MWPKKTGSAQTGASILNSCDFHAFIDPWSFIWRKPNLTVEVPAINRKLHSIVEVNRASCFRDTSDQSFGFCSWFSVSFLHKHKNYFNSGMHTLIELKFSTRAGQSKANLSTKCCEDPTKIYVVINDYSKVDLLTGLQGKTLTGSTWKSVCS